MATIEIEKEKLDAMLADLAVELAPMLKAEAQALAKAADEDSPAEESEGSGEPAGPPASESEESAPAEDSGPPAEASAPAPEASAPAPEMSAPAPEASAAPGQDQAIQPAPTVEALQAEYAKLDPEAQKMHYLAVKAALLATMGAAGGAGPAGPEASAGAPPMGAPPAGPEASAGAPPMGPPPPEASAPMQMGEMKAKQLAASPGNGGKLGKSEEQVKIEALTKQVEEQNTALAGLAKAFDKLTTPQRKAVTGISQLRYLQKSAEEPAKPVAQLTKKEVDEKLKDKIREGKLSKSDKDLVAKYTVGAVDISKIEHLLVNAAK